MPPRAEITFVGFDSSTRTPMFSLELGSNVRYGVELTTDNGLLEPWNAQQRNPANFFHSGLIDTSAGGQVSYVVPAASLLDLSFSTGHLFYRVSTFASDNGDRRFSTAFGDAANAPSISTALPVISGLDPSSSPLGVATTVRITGQNLRWVYQAKFGNVVGTNTQVHSDTEVTTEVPTQSNTGSYVVVVRSPFGESVVGPGSNFDYTAALPPVPLLPPPEIVDIGVLPLSLDGSPDHDPERFSGASEELRRGRTYRIEVVYDRAFTTLPDASTTVTVDGTAFNLPLHLSPDANNIAVSDPFLLD